MNIALIFVFAIILAVIGGLIYYLGSEKAFNITWKIFASVFFVIVNILMFFGDGFIFETIKGKSDPLKIDTFTMILKWGLFMLNVLIPMSVFFKNKVFRTITIFFCLPFAIMATCCYGKFMEYFTSSSAIGFDLPLVAREVMFSFQLICAIGLPLGGLITEHWKELKNGKMWLNSLYSLLPLIILLMPAYVPQILFGYGTSYLSDWYIRIGWLTILIGGTIALYFIFRNKSRDLKLEIVWLLVITFFTYYMLTMLYGFNIKRLPLQLCNLAIFIYPVLLLTKSQKLFSFCITANLFGALIAICMPENSYPMLEFWAVHFVWHHTLVFLIPCLCLGFRLFKIPRFKDFLWAMLFFTVYLIMTTGLAMLFANVKISFLGTPAKPKTINYFYVIDYQTAVKTLGFMEFATRTLVNVGQLTLAPFLILFVYVAYMLLMLLVLALVKLICIIDERLKFRSLKRKATITKNV